MHIGVAISSAAAIQETWTTAALVAAAQRQGHTAWVVPTRDWSVDGDAVMARAFRMGPGAGTRAAVANALGQRTAPRERIAVERFDRLLHRAAPLDTTLLSFALLAERRGVPVVNRPTGVLLAAHKSWVASLGLATPRTLATQSRAEAHLFFDSVGDIVVKPNRGLGGHGVSRVLAGDGQALDQAFAVARRAGDGVVVVQAWVDGADRGEKRLMWCDGELLGGYLRRRAPGEFRHNLKQGATAEPLVVEDSDRALSEAVTPHLLAAGIRVAGLDVLGGLLVEVNAVNPGGTVLTDALHGTSLADDIVRQICRRA